MLRARTRYVLLGAVAGIACATASSALAFQPPSNCPTVEDQVVNVTDGTPVEFRLRIDNPEGTVVSVFQPPLGGTLVPTGPTPLDYAFIPDADFSGRTTFTYRIVPPRGCGRGATLATVTLLDGTPTAAIELDGRVGVYPALCGRGLLAAVVMAFGAIGVIEFVRRRGGP